VDVRDTAKLHVAALTLPEDGNVGSRIFGFGYPYNWNDVLAILRKLYPNKTFIDDLPGIGRDLSHVPNEGAEGILKSMKGGKGFTTLEESLRDSFADVKA
jgi:hypothetical protein